MAKKERKKVYPERSRRVFVALSGGVDSSVAALLLKKQGYDVVGVHMKCYNLDGCGERDARDAKRAADALSIPFYVFDFEKEYKKKVVDYMIGGYRKGITPNPDVMCNKEIKFGLFLKKALKMGAPACRQAGIYIATGHYARKREIKNQKSKIKNADKMPRVARYALCVARDAQKDQSYFLWTLTQEQLKHCLFPVGDYLKSEVRQMARRAGLPTADKKDSQGVCFIGKISLPEFLSSEIPVKKGPVLNLDGEKIGEHDGAQFYTIGQRRLGIANYESGIRGQREMKPLYVAEKNVKTNTLVVTEGSDNPALYKKEIGISGANFQIPLSSLIRANGRMDVLARIRYRQPLVKARIMNDESGIANKKELKTKNKKTVVPDSEFIIQFDQPVKFVAPGQSAVFYEYKKNPSASAGLKMLGGGIIL